MPAANFLPPVTVLDGELVTQFCHPGTSTRWIYPQSRLLREAAREPLRAMEPDDAAHEAACDRFEFLASMMALDNPAAIDRPRAWHGEFFIHNFDELAAHIEREIAPGWPLLEAGAFGGDADRAKVAHQAVLKWRTDWPPRW